MIPEDPVKIAGRIMPDQEKALKRLGINTVRDLLYHFPVRYGDTSHSEVIENLRSGEAAVIFGKLSGLKARKAWKRRIPMSEGFIEDNTEKAKVLWFNQPYMAKMFPDGSYVRIEGKASVRNGQISFSNPKIEKVPELPAGAGVSLFTGKEDHELYPVYPETKGISSNWLIHKIKTVFSAGMLDELADPIPESILKAYSLPDLKTALIWIHTPHKIEHALAARKRFAFEEIFFIQLEKEKQKRELAEQAAYKIEKPAKMDDFIKRFPFQMTGAQKKAIEQILADFKRGHPMARLLEGDVGSGKTAVAAAAAFAAATSRPQGQSFGTLQAAYMAPTEILAQQHFQSFIHFFKHLPINIALITGSGARKFPSKVDPSGSTPISKSQLLKWMANGEIAMVVGTHALIQKTVKFKHLGLVIIDEQHRFGTKQRQGLVEKHELTPHLLSMTATPIPRTLALTIYGDLDLTLLDEMPAGRKKIITEIIAPAQREKVYEEIRKELKAGRQMYVICPRIDEPDPEKEMAIQAKSVKEEAKRLKKDVFPEYEIAVLHSKMKPAEKEKIMNDFKAHKIDILVSTSVVEVGVNVENASIIIIEGAERFGLSQLHQLRGRVLRGTHQPYCYVFTESKSEKTLERLKALKTAKNGFELAEFDLQQRGAGELAGGKQWGISDLGMEAIKNLKMVEAARTEARKIIESDPDLKKYPLLSSRLSASSQKIHFE